MSNKVEASANKKAMGGDEKDKSDMEKSPTIKQQSGKFKDDESDDNSLSPARKNDLHEEDGPLLLKRGVTGQVDFFSFKNGYGFIETEEGERVFVHSRSVCKFLPKILCELHPGEKVEFDIIKTVRGKEAVAVTGIGGVKVGTGHTHPRGQGRSRADSSPAQWREVNHNNETKQRQPSVDTAKGKGGKKDSHETKNKEAESTKTGGRSRRGSKKEAKPEVKDGDASNESREPNANKGRGRRNNRSKRKGSVKQEKGAGESSADSKA